MATKLDAENSLLLVVDMQERLVPAIDGRDSLVAAVGTLLQAAQRLSLPVLATEQNPEGLGGVVAELSEAIPSEARVTKMTFDAAGESSLLARLDSSGRTQIVLCGAEAHVCVLQTALGLKAAGYDVFAVADAIGSRDPANRQAALARLGQAGIVTVTTEMVVFEWLGRSDRPEFKELLALIK
ncbi:MAG: hydrolase [Rhodovibrionaceae bacterium]|nr:hydrolase [Rhodovibrionaceae bacterium]